MGTTLLMSLGIALLLAGPADGVRVVAALHHIGARPYVIAGAWLLAAPLVLGVAAGALRRTPWPWVAAITLHLVVVTALVVRLRELLPGSAWGAVTALVVVGTTSAVVVTAPSGE